jgi:hypothetical protein
MRHANEVREVGETRETRDKRRKRGKKHTRGKRETHVLALFVVQPETDLAQHRGEFRVGSLPEYLKKRMLSIKHAQCRCL